MEFTRLLVVGACLLFLQSAVYARSVEEMVIGDDESSNSLAEKMIEENPMEQNAAGLSQYDLAPTTDDVNDELVMEDNDIGKNLLVFMRKLTEPVHPWVSEVDSTIFDSGHIHCCKQ